MSIYRSRVLLQSCCSPLYVSISDGKLCASAITLFSSSPQPVLLRPTIDAAISAQTCWPIRVEAESLLHSCDTAHVAHPAAPAPTQHPSAPADAWKSMAAPSPAPPRFPPPAALGAPKSSVC